MIKAMIKPHKPMPRISPKTNPRKRMKTKKREKSTSVLFLLDWICSYIPISAHLKGDFNRSSLRAAGFKVFFSSEIEESGNDVVGENLNTVIELQH